MTVSGASIRQGGAGDVGAIARVVERAFELYVPRMGLRPAPMDADHAGLVDREQVWVADDAGRVIGVIVLVPGRDHLFVDILAVDPERQGEGLGRDLLAFAGEEATRRGMRELRLSTNEAMTENLELYARLGWEETGRGIDQGYRRVFFRRRVVQ